MSLPHFPPKSIAPKFQNILINSLITQTPNPKCTPLLLNLFTSLLLKHTALLLYFFTP